jgi:phosphatidate cytidylyltransferase
MKILLTRFISAAVAVLVLITTIIWGGHLGYEILVSMAVLIGGLELIKILFKDSQSKTHKFAFYFSLISIYFFSCLYPSIVGLVFTLISVLFCLFTLLISKRFSDLKEVSILQSKSILGFFYLGLLPTFAHQILNIPQGHVWFLSLLAIVFAGDIGAYLVGVKFGQRKIMPAVSPKKTLEGAIGGLLFSGLTSVVCASYLNHELVPMLLLGLSAAVVAQFGDLFESLLKRIAEVKDSGKIMPGHGGILDRIDGVLFASPVVLFGALLLEGLLK